MQIIIHRVNTIELLKKVPVKYGVEIDVRGYGDTILLNHDPISNAETHTGIESFLQNYNHSFVIFNIKEAGYENRVIDMAAKYNIENYFLLDVEFPYFYTATRKQNVRKIAARYSEAEPIEFALAQVENEQPLVDWVWIDTNTSLPLDKTTAEKLSGFKICLVCPERWGRPEDIEPYKAFLKQQEIPLDAVMTSLECAAKWEI